MTQIKRKIMKEIEVTMNLVPYWIVRVMRIDVFDMEEIIDEKEFDYTPSEKDIAEFLSEYNDREVFANVVLNYRLEKVK